MLAAKWISIWRIKSIKNLCRVVLCDANPFESNIEGKQTRSGERDEEKSRGNTQKKATTEKVFVYSSVVYNKSDGAYCLWVRIHQMLI